MKNKGITYADFVHSRSDLKAMQIKNYELYEIISKLKSYEKRPNKIYLKVFYQIAIVLINFIAEKEIFLTKI